VTVSTCPDGHASGTDDYCDVCGTPMTAAAAAAPQSSVGVLDGSATGPGAGSAGSGRAGADAPEVCASCGAARDGRFCEACGHDSALPIAAALAPAASVGCAGPASNARPARTGWSAVVRADRDWFDEVRRRDGPDTAEVSFPPFCPERRFALEGERLTIGRRSRSRGIEPDIDLSGPPLDPGVSALHAMLLAQPDGGWQIVDLDSTNGTTVGSGVLTPNTPVPVGVELIKLGAWTTITLVPPP